MGPTGGIGQSPPSVPISFPADRICRRLQLRIQRLRNDRRSRDKQTSVRLPRRNLSFLLGRLPDQIRRRSAKYHSAAATIATTFGLPSVSVPVLSTTSVSTFSRRSRASAFLINTPARAPRPTPTMIDIGVAKPSAQGQAIIKTLTGATHPNTIRGSAPNIVPP